VASFQLRQLFKPLLSRGSIVAVFVLLTLALFLVKLPTWILDVLLVGNLFLAILLLLRSLYAERNKTLYSFPAILVLATLFRLGLNVSSTKLILLQGDQGLDAAGKMIQAFGTFVVRGDFIVGFIVFAIIAVVNFVVIAKGSARVAEVAARFSLDSLPGRQLSIDSDLRAETITSSQARTAREDLDRQSQFFGSMDGAMKWVQGDAIAGFVITFINLIGGVSVGVSRGMGLGDAVNTFGILTIGEGLLNILPSLLISVAAGIVVTNAIGAKGEDSADEMLGQLMSEPKAPVLAALALLVVGAFGLVGISDFPFLPFFVLGGAMLVFMYFLRRSESEAEELQTSAGAAVINGGGWPLALEAGIEHGSQYVHPLTIELDIRGLGPLLTKSSSPWARQFWAFAELQAQEYYSSTGIPLPRPVLVSHPGLAEGEYRILVRDRVLRSGRIQPGNSFVSLNETTALSFGGTVLKTQVHPVSQRGACWIKSDPAIERCLARLRTEVRSPFEFLWLDAVGALLESVDEIFGIAEVKNLIHGSEKPVRLLVEELLAEGKLSYPEFTDVLRRLARERVSIRDIKRLVEGIAEFAVLTPKDQNRKGEWLLELHEFLRFVMVRGILAQSTLPGGGMRTFLLSKEVEDEFQAAISLWDRMRMPPPLEPLFAQSLRDSAQRLFAPVLERGATPVVIVCPSEIRLAVQEFFSRHAATSDWLRTVTYEEISGVQNVELVSVLHAPV
jgi:type III secretory pathway component EscV